MFLEMLDQLNEYDGDIDEEQQINAEKIEDEE